MEQYLLGKKYLDAEQFSQAQEAFLMGWEQGQIHCAYGLLAVAAMTGSDRTEPLQRLGTVLPQLQQLAAGQEAEACFILGRCHETGSLVDRDLGKTMEYYVQASAAGHTDAMFNLGCIYMHLGEAGETIGIDYFTRAAQKGHAEARAALAHYYAQRGQRYTPPQD